MLPHALRVCAEFEIAVSQRVCSRTATGCAEVPAGRAEPQPRGGVQALCSQVFKDNPPRRMVNVGLDFRRFDQVLAVLIKHGRLKLYDQDVRANVLGGVPAVEPAVDAAIAAAIVSSFSEAQLPADTAFIGEVDLGGALAQRRSGQMQIGAMQTGTIQTVLLLSDRRAGDCL